MGWDSAKELGTIQGLAFLFWVYRWFGRFSFKLALAPVLIWFFIFKTVPRKASREYLGHVLKRPVGMRDCIRHYFTFGESVLDKLIAWNGGFSLSAVEFHGHEIIKKTLAEGKGCLLIGSHLGNLEVSRVLSTLRPNLEVHVLGHTKNSKNFNAIMKRLDPSSRMNLHEVTELDAGLAAWMSERVSQGAVVVVTGDRLPVGGGQRVGTVSFFGKEAAFPYGPYILAATLGCPTMLFFCLRRPSDQPKYFDVYYEAFEERIVLPRTDRERTLKALASRYAARLEYYCSKAPYQWYNFYPFWLQSSLA